MGPDAFVHGALVVWGAIIPLVIRLNRRRWHMTGMDVAFLLMAILILLIFVAIAVGPIGE
jgi:hypothetical protein